MYEMGSLTSVDTLLQIVKQITFCHPITISLSLLFPHCNHLFNYAQCNFCFDNTLSESPKYLHYPCARAAMKGEDHSSYFLTQSAGLWSTFACVTDFSRAAAGDSCLCLKSHQVLLKTWFLQFLTFTYSTVRAAMGTYRE